MRFPSDKERFVRKTREEILAQATTHFSGDPYEGLSVAQRVKRIGEEMVERAMVSGAVAELAVSEALARYEHRFQG